MVAWLLDVVKKKPCDREMKICAWLLIVFSLYFIAAHVDRSTSVVRVYIAIEGDAVPWCPCIHIMPS